MDFIDQTSHFLKTLTEFHHMLLGASQEQREKIILHISYLT